MSTLPVTNTLTAAFLPLGWIGAVFAILCALVALIAIARGAAGLTGGALGLWFVGALLSVASSFAEEWSPLLLSAGALAVALVVGGMARMLTLPTPAITRALAARPAVAGAVETTPAAPAPVLPTPVLPASLAAGHAAYAPGPRTPRTQSVTTSGSAVTA